MNLKYLCPDKKILENSKIIRTQLELKEAVKFWRKKLRIKREINIDASFSLPKLLDLFKRPWATILLFGGAYMRLLKDKTYEIKLNPKRKFSNEGSLVHELLHIKLEHDIKYFICLFRFEIEANKNLMKYRNLLMKRNNKY